MNILPFPDHELSNADIDPPSFYDRVRHTAEILLGNAVDASFGSVNKENEQPAPIEPPAVSKLQPVNFKQPAAPSMHTTHPQYIEALASEPLDSSIHNTPKPQSPEIIATAYNLLYPAAERQQQKVSNLTPSAAIGSHSDQTLRQMDARAKANQIFEKMAEDARTLNQQERSA